MVSVSINSEFSQRSLNLDEDRIDHLIEVARYSKSDFDVLYPSTVLSEVHLRRISKLKSSSKKIKRSKILEELTKSEIAAMYGKKNDLKRKRRSICYEKDLSIVELELMTREYAAKETYTLEDKKFIRWLIEECYYTSERLMKEYGYRLSDVFDSDQLKKFVKIDRSVAESRCLDRVSRFLDSNLSKIESGEIDNATISKECHVLDENVVKYLRQVLGKEEFCNLRKDLKFERFKKTCQKVYGVSNVFSSRDIKEKIVVQRATKTTASLKFDEIKLDNSRRKFESLNDLTFEDFHRMIEHEGYSISDLKHQISESVSCKDLKSRIRCLASENHQSIVLRLRRSDSEKFADLHARKILNLLKESDVRNINKSDLSEKFYVPYRLCGNVLDILNNGNLETEAGLIDSIILELRDNKQIVESISNVLDSETDMSLKDFLIGLRSRRSSSISNLIDLINTLENETIALEDCKLLQILKLDLSRDEMIDLSNSTNIIVDDETLDKFSLSSYERKIYDILTSLVNRKDIRVRDRSTLESAELDFLIPSMNLAIEVNPNFTHHSNHLINDRTRRIYDCDGKDSSYHFRKFKECQSLGIRLLSFYEHDFEERRFNNFTRRLIESCIRDEDFQISRMIIKELAEEDLESLQFVTSDLKPTHSIEIYSSDLNQIESILYVAINRKNLTVLDLDQRYRSDILNEKIFFRLINVLFDKFKDIEKIQTIFRNDYYDSSRFENLTISEDQLELQIDDLDSIRRFNGQYDRSRRYNIISTCGTRTIEIDRPSDFEILKKGSDIL